MKKNGVDSWCKIPVETIEIDGVKVTVNGLTVSQLASLTSGKRSNMDQSIAMICTCCELDGGGKLDEGMVLKIRADVYKILSEAVARVNGLDAGNSGATDGDDTFSA